MSDDFDSLTILLKLLMPSLSARDQYDLLSCLNAEQRDAIVNEAKQQGVSLPLYPILVALEKTYNLVIPSKEKHYQAYLSTAAKNMVALHDAERLFSTLQKEGIPVAGLKGIYLLEQVYGNIGARSMNDIDILVKKNDLAGCLKVMQELGYKPTAYFSLEDQNIDTKHVPPMQKAGGHMLEALWTLLEEYEP
ncbi:MAG TPA: nucleotidyltransferase family protein, partial [Anaerolineaceae bacterium]|nr:nucleotidyltransferase family protein [Anaerolineaceae bacterium]